MGADRRGTSVSTVEATAAGSEAVDVAAIGAYLHRHTELIRLELEREGIEIQMAHQRDKIAKIQEMRKRFGF